MKNLIIALLLIPLVTLAQKEGRSVITYEKVTIPSITPYQALVLTNNKPEVAYVDINGQFYPFTSEEWTKLNLEAKIKQAFSGVVQAEVAKPAVKSRRRANIQAEKDELVLSEENKKTKAQAEIDRINGLGVDAPPK